MHLSGRAGQGRAGEGTGVLGKCFHGQMCDAKTGHFIQCYMYETLCPKIQTNCSCDSNHKSLRYPKDNEVVSHLQEFAWLFQLEMLPSELQTSATTTHAHCMSHYIHRFTHYSHTTPRLARPNCFPRLTTNLPPRYCSHHALARPATPLHALANTSKPRHM